MFANIHRLVLLLLICTAAQAAEPTSEADQYWPQWRGPLANGVAPFGDPPVRWDENTNVRWKFPLPGQGHATPVVWGDRIFVLAAVVSDGNEDNKRGLIARLYGTLKSEDIYRYEVLAIDRKTGNLLWRKTARVEAPHEGRHKDASWASCSPITDGEYVIASFGSRGLYCYDMQGNLQWEKDFGDLNMRNQFGEASSPFLYGDRLIVTWDHEGSSFITALDKHTGREIWRKERDEETSWSTPVVVEHNGRAQIITTAILRVRSYDLETGKLLWETRGMTKNPIPMPVAADGIVYVMGGFRESILQAISLDKAQGDAATSNAILWELTENTPYVPSPLLYDGLLYFLKSNKNMFSCYDAKTGTPHYTVQRLEGVNSLYASPVAAQDRIYLAGREGITTVIKHGPKFEVLAQNTLNDRFDASPVIVGKELYLRGHKSLYCIASE